jgi:hypothetical protein
LPRILDLRMHPVSWPSARAAQRASVLLHPGKKLSAGGAPKARNVLHDEDTWLEEINVLQESCVYISSRVVFQPRTVICTVDLARNAETLTWRAPHNYVNMIDANHRGQFTRRHLRQIADKCVPYIGQIAFRRRAKICFQRFDGLGIDIDRRRATEASTQHP